MATTLRDFIAQRETEIRDQQRALKAEMRELQIAKSALDGQPAPAAFGAQAPMMTIKDMAREILAAQPGGLNSSGILDGIKKTFGRDVERTSLSPQLSRLKDDDELVLEGEVWFTSAHYAAKLARVFGAAGEALSTRAKAMPERSPFDEPVNTEDFGLTPNTSWNHDQDDDVPF